MSDKLKRPAAARGAEDGDAFATVASASQTAPASAEADSPIAANDMTGLSQALGDFADTAVQAVGGDTATKAQKLFSAASSATGLLQAAQTGNTQTLLAEGAQLAGLADSDLAQVANAASQVSSLARSFNSATEGVTESTPSFLAAGRVPDEHPLGGQAIQDFISQPAFYTPPAISPQSIEAAGPGLLDDKQRLLRLYAPLDGDKRLYVAALEGNAALSNPYRYRLQLLSQHAAIDLQEVMGKSFTVGIRLADDTEHSLNGYVTAFGFSHTDGGLAVYTAEITPWLWYLEKRITSRIFQDMSVLDVLDKVFKDYGGLPDYKVRVSKRPEPETYIVQYDESDLDFVSRLLERHGLFYYFEHRPDGHTLVISDNSTNSEFCPPQQAHAMVRYNAGDHVDSEDSLTALSAYRNFQPSVVALNTFKYTDPHTIQYVEQPTVARQGEVPRLTVYHGNPAYTHKDKEAGNQDAQRLMEAYEWQAKLFVAQSECRGMVVGHTFQLSGHHWFESGDDADFLVVGAQIDARNNFKTGDDSAEGADVYQNTLTLIRRKIPYRPVRQHAKPVMKGPQTATVVGPGGQEIYTDKYGRIKVQFPWDLEGRHNESSSCWIRVSQPWAGKGWGTVAIPRIGQEVIVDYIEGDPDRPLCVGRLFNSAQGVPMGMPDGAHTMGFISNSTPGGGGQCRMTIRDQAGQELIDLFSQKDMTTETLNDHHTTVRGPSQTNTVTTGAQTNTVKKSIVNVAQTEHMVNVAHTHMVMAAETDYMGLLAKQAVTIQSTHDLIGALAKNAVVVKSESDCIYLEAATTIVLKVGASSITLTQDGGIFIDGVLVQVKGSQSIDLNP